MKQLLVILLLGIISPVLAQEETSKTPVIAIRVALGESVMIDGYYFEFTEVLEDSRCPTNVQCVWAGRARVSVMVGEDTRVEWIFGQTMAGESSEKVYAFNEEWSIEGVQLIPYPNEPGEELDYVLLVKKVPTQ